MVRSAPLWFSAIVFLFGWSVAASAAGKPGDVNTMAVDFPPGNFTDGRAYSLEDFRGKVVVLYFFEPT